MTDNTPSVNRLELIGVRRDPFTGIPDMSRVFYGLADFISVWVHRYGFRVDDIDAGEVGWKNPTMLTFRVWLKGSRRSVLSPARYDTRLPEHPLALMYRIPRVQGFLWQALWFKRIMGRVDNFIRGWGMALDVPMDRLEVAARWPSSGHVVLKLIHPDAPQGARRYMTHYRKD